jgi:CRISPR/Cas system-associated endonuclease Cas3-HD
MATIPTEEQLIQTFYAAGKAHHEFQTNFLDGVRHEGWAWWYSAYILGRLGDFTSPTLLTQWLEEVSDEKSWFKKAAAHVHSKIRTD